VRKPEGSRTFEVMARKFYLLFDAAQWPLACWTPAVLLASAWVRSFPVI